MIAAITRFDRRGREVVSTHDDARALLSNAVPGAKVTFRRPHLRSWDSETRDSDMAYHVKLERCGRSPIVRMGAYSLPADAANLVNDARNAVESAIRDTQR